MPPRKVPNQNASGSNNNEIDPENPPTAAQFQKLMQAMLEQQRQANENQVRLQREANENQDRFQEQLAKKNEEMAQVQRQLLEVLHNRPQPQPPPMQPLGPNIIINNRDHDPNILFEKFRKRGPKEFLDQEDPLAVDDWLVNIENIFDVFTCTGRENHSFLILRAGRHMVANG